MRWPQPSYFLCYSKAIFLVDAEKVDLHQFLFQLICSNSFAFAMHVGVISKAFLSF